MVVVATKCDEANEILVRELEKLINRKVSLIWFLYFAHWIQQPIHTACISFWIPKKQAIFTDTSFEVKTMVKIYAIEIIFGSHEPFQSYLLTGQA